jgi:transcription-repair coupling factor (superfamily II helicase)
MDAVGYDLYIKLLNQAVLEEKGEPVKAEPECTISVNFDAYIPDKYVPYPSQRMEMYKKIAMIEGEQDKEDILDEMLDRFGDIPKATENLLNIALVRADGKRCGIKQIRQEGDMLQIYPERVDLDVWTELSSEHPGRLRMALAGEPHLNFKMKSGEDALTFIHKMFEKYTEIAQKNNA